MNDGEFQENIDIEQVNPLIKEYVESIPFKNRDEAIANAKEKNDAFMTKIWNTEIAGLPTSMIAEHHLTEDLNGWNRYLQVVYTRESKYQRERFGFQEWSIKYLMEMLRVLEDDAIAMQQTNNKNFIRVKESYYKYYSENFGSFSSEVARGIYEPINSESLLVHTLSETDLLKVISSGVLGRGGIAGCAMSQDRFIYDDGYAIIFQAKDLAAVGYPLLQINEDGRDSEILKEWRTPMPIDASLARLIVETKNIPGREKGNQAQIATSYYGEEYLQAIPRL